MSVFVPFSRVPDLGGEYIRRYREVEIQYKILQFLTPLYEQAKVEERRQTPSVVVLDRAGPAERKSKPKVMLYALTAFFVSLLLSFAGVFSTEWIRNLKHSHPGRFQEIVDTSRKDWFGLRISRRRR
jgi:tyrosine-protein kinase Etk/Wzc